MNASETKEIQAAIEYATKKHQGQFRRGGEPYIIHPIAVYEDVRRQGLGREYQITALFHDLLEDTDATEEEILELGGMQVLEAVKVLTKCPGYKMEEYMGAIKENSIAYAIKKADRLHNLQCAKDTDNRFKKRYILETIEWYLDFGPEIRTALFELVESLEIKQSGEGA